MAYTIKNERILPYSEEKASIHREDGRLNISNLCKDLGIELAEVEFKNDKISGVLILDSKENQEKNWKIYVNKTDSINRKRFTIAHELGHYFSYQCDSLSKAPLDEKFIMEDHAFLARSRSTNECELEANEIAGNLLMPDSVIRKLVAEGHNVEELAAYFGVSESAMTIRLKNVGFKLLESAS